MKSTSEESLDIVLHKHICPFAFVEPVDENKLENQIKEFRKNADSALEIDASNGHQPPITDEEKYLRECHKYCLAPVEKFKKFLRDPAQDKIVLNVILLFKCIRCSLMICFFAALPMRILANTNYN
jgi:hypothetical protein